MRAISTHGLTKIFNDARAVDAVTMHIERGEIYGLIGKNGAGKSTLMKMIAGLTIPTSGDIEALDPNVILHVNTMFPTPLALFAEITFSGLAPLPLVVAYAGLEAFFEDLNAGFIKTICSSTLGRGGYALEKVIFLGIITLMGFVLLMPISIVTALVIGSTFSTLDGMGAACAWLTTWAITCIPLALGLLTRWKPLTYAVPAILAGGMIPGLLGIIAECPKRFPTWPVCSGPYRQRLTPPSIGYHRRPWASSPATPRTCSEQLNSMAFPVCLPGYTSSWSPEPPCF